VLYYLCFLPQRDSFTAVYVFFLLLFYLIFNILSDMEVTSLLEGLKFEENISARYTIY